MQAWFEQMGLLELNEVSVIVRLLLAMVCSGILGFERTRKRRPAGLRTYMLVCLGSTVVMMTGVYLYQYMGGGFDPARMAAQVVSGIGFIGAGTIMVTRYYRVKGLTTAAGLWVSACMGLAIGVGFYFGAIITCIALVLIMVFADRFEIRYAARLRRMHMYIIIDDLQGMKAFLHYIRGKNISVSDLETTGADIRQGIGLFCTLKPPAPMDHRDVMNCIEAAENVLFAEEIEA